MSRHVCSEAENLSLWNVAKPSSVFVALFLDGCRKLHCVTNNLHRNVDDGETAGMGTAIEPYDIDKSGTNSYCDITVMGVNSVENIVGTVLPSNKTERVVSLPPSAQIVA